MEDVHKDVLVVGEYEISDDYDMQVDLEVRDIYLNDLILISRSFFAFFASRETLSSVMRITLSVELLL